jgi:hypothetical protein
MQELEKQHTLEQKEFHKISIQLEQMANEYEQNQKGWNSDARRRCIR